MRLGRGLAGVVAIMLAMGIVARADDAMAPNPSGDTDQTVTPAPTDTDTGETPAPAAPTTPRPAIMWGLDQTPVGKGLDAVGINIYGYVEGGYLYDLTNSHDLTPAKSAPADDIFFAGPYKNSLVLDQANFSVDRVVDGSKWDVGFKVNAIYGRDAFFTHSNGILNQNNKSGGTHGPDDQLDIPEVYVSFGMPVLSGWVIQIGKMADLLGVEIDPTQNAFYTHSYTFSYGSPYTNTGMLSTLKFGVDATDQTSSSLIAGVTRGWNQSTYDNNGDPDGLLGFSHSTQHVSASFKFLFGPEGNLPYGPPDNVDWWFTPELTLSYAFDNGFKLGVDVIYGDVPHLTQWCGGAIYGQYKMNKVITFNTRAELYYDGKGLTTGVGGGDVNYTEITTGMCITPCPDIPVLNGLNIRPEIRGDIATQPVLDLSHWSQLTAAVDVYWKF